MKKKNKAALIAVIVCLITAIPVSLVVVGNNAASSIIGIDPKQTEDNSGRFLDEVNFNEDEFISRWRPSSEKITYISSNGNSVYFEYICCNKFEYGKTTIILIPPYGFDYTVMSPIADALLNKGYNVIMYDQRGHGRNSAQSFTFGYLESDDLDAVIQYMQANVAEKPVVGVLGQGTGASTAAYYIGNGYASQYIDFAILENPYSSAEDKFDILLNNKKSVLPYPVYNWTAKGSVKFKYDFDIDTINIAEHISSTDVPVLVINQNGCDECPVSSSNNVYQSIKSENKKIVTFDNKDFLKLFYSDNEKYVDSVTEFISENE